jgi:DNA replication protein DnaC
MTLSHKAKPLLPPPTRATLQALTRRGMSDARIEQTQMPEMTEGPFEERLGLLVDRAMTAREDRRLKTRCHTAKLRQTAYSEESDERHPRGLAKALLRRWATWQWVRARHHVLSTGPTGIGTTWLACALGPQACREGWTALSLRRPRLLQALPLAQGDGRYEKRMPALAKTAVLMLDDWGLAPRRDDHRRDLLELLEERHACRATIVTSPLPVEHWHAAIGEPTWAAALLDRLVHNAYKRALKGDSMRTRQGTAPRPEPAG